MTFEHNEIYGDIAFCANICAFLMDSNSRRDHFPGREGILCRVVTHMAKNARPAGRVRPPARPQLGLG